MAYLRNMRYMGEYLSENIEFLITADRIIDMFRKDVEDIKMRYLNGKISRSQAKEYLEELKRTAEELESHTREIKILIHQLADVARNIMKRAEEIERPQVGVPINVVVREIIEMIHNIDV